MDDGWWVREGKKKGEREGEKEREGAQEHTQQQPLLLCFYSLISDDGACDAGIHVK